MSWMLRFVICGWLVMSDGWVSDPAFEALMDALDEQRMDRVLGEWPAVDACDLENPESCESCQ